MTSPCGRTRTPIPAVPRTPAAGAAAGFVPPGSPAETQASRL
ncbi:MAG TPA: hypothetical protein VGR07_08480 [Thermoanaerobaculia bacterium]|nr:hypothetical protein [Thermoanaerobaculia bacterium]